MNEPNIYELNLLKARESMGLLYQTYITDRTQAAYRGLAIQMIDNLILSIQEDNDPENLASAITAFESVPWSKRMRDSGDPVLAEIAKNTANKLFDAANPLNDNDQD
jgi:hypothetical protein